MRQSTRRQGSYRKRDEEYSRDEFGSEKSSKQPEGNVGQGDSNESKDSLIAEMAKGFVEAQAKLSGQQNGSGNQQEMLALLQKISRQLENVAQPQNGQQGVSPDSQNQSGKMGNSQQPGSGSGNNGAISEQYQASQQNNSQQNNSQQNNSQQNNSQQNEAQATQELRSLFSRLLTDESQSGGTSRGGQASSAGTGRSGGGNNNKTNTITAQTAAQVLAEAQYELSKELEASLKNLKQVISESEKLANKISNLLGEENSSEQKS